MREFVYVARTRHTVVDLLQSDDRVGRQTLLRVLGEQEGLGGDGALLRRGHARVLVGGIHAGRRGRCAAAGRRCRWSAVSLRWAAVSRGTPQISNSAVVGVLRRCDCQCRTRFWNRERRVLRKGVVGCSDCVGGEGAASGGDGGREGGRDRLAVVCCSWGGCGRGGERVEDEQQRQCLCRSEVWEVSR